MSSPAANETVLCDLIRELLMSNDAVLNDKISLRENSLVQGRLSLPQYKNVREGRWSPRPSNDGQNEEVLIKPLKLRDL